MRMQKSHNNSKEPEAKKLHEHFLICYPPDIPTVSGIWHWYSLVSLKMENMNKNTLHTHTQNASMNTCSVSGYKAMFVANGPRRKLRNLPNCPSVFHNGLDF